MNLRDLESRVLSQPLERVEGRLVQAVGNLIEAEIPGAALGALCTTESGAMCEVVGFRERRAILMPLDVVENIVFGARVRLHDDAIRVPVGDALLGRIIDGLGRPIDDGPPLPLTPRRPLTGLAPPPMSRAIVSEPVVTGMRVIDGMLTLGKGQRIGIMAGSGVGKSTLLGSLARQMQVDVNVICLVGERGREVREFVEHSLGPEGLARSVVVVVTSDRSPALQVKAPFLATAIAEHFRDQGRDVLLLVDSLTRLALAQRQIGLAAGEPPTTRGFTPSVFSMLAPLLERAGPGRIGSITGIYTVLIEGDDLHDPIGDAVRGIVDGHIVLSRKLGSHGHYPAVDVLGSLSRIMDRLITPEHRAAASRVRSLMATYQENEELVRLGAYRRGASAEVDRALDRMPGILGFLKQGTAEPTAVADTVARLRKVAGD